MIRARPRHPRSMNPYTDLKAALRLGEELLRFGEEGFELIAV
jgi:hypothetical protein